VNKTVCGPDLLAENNIYKDGNLSSPDFVLHVEEWQEHGLTWRQSGKKFFHEKAEKELQLLYSRAVYINRAGISVGCKAVSSVGRDPEEKIKQPHKHTRNC